MGWKKNGQQNKTRQEKKEEKMGKKEEEETGRNKAKQAKGVMGLMLWDVCGVRVAWFRCKTHTHTHIHKKGWESIYRRGNSSTYLTNHANRGAIIDKEGGRGRRRRRRMVGQVVGDSSSALLSLCLFPNNNALVLPSSIALQPPPSHPTKTLLLLHLLLLLLFVSAHFIRWKFLSPAIRIFNPIIQISNLDGIFLTLIIPIFKLGI